MGQTQNLMLTDIFSSFDPITINIFSTSQTIFWLITFVSLILLHTSYWLFPSRISALPPIPINIIFSQASRTIGHNLKGFSSLLTSLFLLILIINLSGLLPYIFSASSHLIVTLSLGLPFWLSLIISSFVHSPKIFTASLLPAGAPDWLNPFLVLIETISISVRPITLSFRLAANMRAGHIVITLLGIFLSAAISTASSSILILLPIQTFYITFELGICLIQAYIFCLLLSLYADDHTS